MKKFISNSFLFITTILVVILPLEVKARSSFKDVLCKSVTIRNVSDINKLQNCTVVTGFVRIVEMDFTTMALEYPNSSNIEEITEYLLVYRVKGLNSLERLFPNLMVIRGVKLLYDQYALIVVENMHLKNIGLLSLLRVLRGSVRIESNPSLCFTNTINWPLILGLENKKYFYDIKNNKSPNQCPLCYTYEDELETKMVNRHKRCWSYGKFQRDTLDYVGDQKCYKSNCLSSCLDRNCMRCVNYVSNRGCEKNCLPPRYKLAFKRQCVTNCSQWGLALLGVECVEKCPKYYHEVKVDGVVKCVLRCKGNFVINFIEDLEGLADCTIINGSLTIEIHETNKPIVQHLENAFRNLNEITGFLKILNSPQIIALHFLKNLNMIKGLELLENRYSLYVVGNNYLQALWPGKVVVVRGCVYFHLNPRLCYDKITDLEKNLKQCRQITITDVSVHSNGERAVCGQDIRTSNASITDVNSNAAVVQVDVLPSDELLLLVGYVYYYKEAPFKNVTKYDGRHGCGMDGWFTDVILTEHRRHVIKNLKPSTQYAYFVNSLTAMDYPYSAEHVSEIQYFQTLPTKPGMVAKLYSLSLSTTELEIHWWPPIITNGVLDKYILQYGVTDAATSSETLTRNLPGVCECPKLNIESLVATPHVESYYSKEQLMYRDSVLNFLFVKRENKATGNSTVKAKRNSTDNEAILEARVQLLLNKLEQEAIDKQEEHKENYDIQHIPPICDQINHNPQEQAEKKCVPLETFKDAIEIPSDRHTYNLYDLEPGKTYHISLRACVKGLANGCGAEKVIWAQTVSKRLEQILESISFLKI